MVSHLNCQRTLWLHSQLLPASMSLQGGLKCLRAHQSRGGEWAHLSHVVIAVALKLQCYAWAQPGTHTLPSMARHLHMNCVIWQSPAAKSLCHLQPQTTLLVGFMHNLSPLTTSRSAYPSFSCAAQLCCPHDHASYTGKAMVTVQAKWHVHSTYYALQLIGRPEGLCLSLVVVNMMKRLHDLTRPKYKFMKSIGRARYYAGTPRARELFRLRGVCFGLRLQCTRAQALPQQKAAQGHSAQ